MSGVCKTAGSAYVGSNPTPATSWSFALRSGSSTSSLRHRTRGKPRSTVLSDSEVSRCRSQARFTASVAQHDGRNGQDEREGFKFLFAGAILGLRNPRGHGPQRDDDPEEAMEYLALASLLMRRLDDAEGTLSP
jgi:uncharacterized protein (TIGR02391 family)